MNRLNFARHTERKHKCSLCQTSRREYVAVSYELGTGFYLICSKCIGALNAAKNLGEASLTVPMDFVTGVEGFARRHE